MTQDSESNTRRRTNYLWIETSVVLLFYLVPLIFNSEADMYGLDGKRPPILFLHHSLYSIITNIGPIALILFIIWRSGDSFTRFGLKPFRFGRDIFGGILILIILRVAHFATWWALRTFLSHESYHAITHSQSGSDIFPPSGTLEFILLAVMCLFSGLVQELIMRAYLITRLEELTASTPIAILFSTMLFVFYHGYEGTAAVIGVAIFGLIQAMIFCLFRRLAPIALAHALNNFIAIGNVPLL